LAFELLVTDNENWSSMLAARRFAEFERKD
jgi:hypothetical protein